MCGYMRACARNSNVSQQPKLHALLKQT